MLVPMYQPYKKGGGLLKPHTQTKTVISALLMGPIEPKKFDFSYKPMRMPIIAFWGFEMAKKGYL